jgi:DNA ligase 1
MITIPKDGFRPLLAPQESPQTFPGFFEGLTFPLLCSPKFDGIRCLVRNGVCLSRTGKIIPSVQVQAEFWRFEHFDGELVEGDPTSANVYNRTQSHVMSYEKPGDIKFHVFDYIHPRYLDEPFHKRLDMIQNIWPENVDNMFFVEHEYVDSLDDLLEYEELCLKRGFEGIMLRNPVAEYKRGRATYKQQIIWKLKRFQDAEAKIIGFEEGQLNENYQEKDELGYAKRSTRKEGMVPSGTLGRFIVNFDGEELSVAPGTFSHPERQMIWNNQEQFLGNWLKFRYMKYGMKDKPRHPRALGMRDDGDMIL